MISYGVSVSPCPYAVFCIWPRLEPSALRKGVSLAMTGLLPASIAADKLEPMNCRRLRKTASSVTSKDLGEETWGILISIYNPRSRQATKERKNRLDFTASKRFQPAIQMDRYRN